MFHVYGHSLLVAMAFEIRGDLKSLPVLRAAYGSTGLNSNNLSAMLSQQTSQRWPNDAGGKTENSNARKRQ
jgi:hypothetical protein